MNRFKPFIAIAAVTYLSASHLTANAAPVMTLSIQYSASFDSDFNYKGLELGALPYPALGVPLPTVLPTDIHWFDVLMMITGLPDGEDFERVIFDAVLGPGVTPYTTLTLPYAANNPLFDPPPNTADGCFSGCLPIYSTNQDAGTLANDLKVITVIANSANSHQGTHFRHPGELEASTNTDIDNSNLAPPTVLGSILVKWNGSGDSDLLSFVGLRDPLNVTNPWASVDANNVQHLFGPETMDQGPRSQWGILPEPTGAMLIVSGFACLLLTRRGKCLLTR